MADEPTNTPPTTAAPPVSEAQTAMAARLNELFPTGVLPGATPARSGENTARTPAPGETITPPAATGPAASGPAESGPAASGPAESGATGPAESGATGPASTGPAESGATGPAESGPAESGPAPLTQEQLDAAAKAMTPQAGTAFKAVRSDLKVVEGKLAEREAKIAELEAVVASAPKVDDKAVAELQAKIADYEATLAVQNVEQTAAFKRDISTPLAAAKKELDVVLTKHKIAESAVRAALSDPDEAARTDKLAELSADMNRLDIIKFDRSVVAIQQLEARRDEELASASTKVQAAAAAQATAAAEQAAKFQADWKGALETSFTKLAELPLFQTTGDAEWDATVSGIKTAVASTDIAKMSNEALATELYKAQVFPSLLTLVADLQSEKISLDEQLTKLRGGTPPAGGTTEQVTPPAASDTVVIDDKTTFTDVLKQKLTGVLPP